MRGDKKRSDLIALPVAIRNLMEINSLTHFLIIRDQGMRVGYKIFLHGLAYRSQAFAMLWVHQPESVWCERIQELLHAPEK